MLDVTPAPSSSVRRAARQELGPLYEELRPHLLRFAEGLLGDRDDAEEAVHDAFAAAVRTGPLEAPRLWLFRVTRNAAVSQLRARRRTVPFEVVEGAACTDPTPHQRVEMAEDVAVLRAGIDRLAEQQRAALLLRELAGCSYREIGEVLDVSEANVKILIYRARRGLESYRAAVQLPCDDARLALSAAHDGECGRAAGARAKLHAASCAGCRRFAGALKDQRAAFATLVPALPDADGVLHAASSHVGDALQAASNQLWQHMPLATGGTGGGTGAMGGLLGLKGAAATTAAVMTVGAGGVAVVHPGPLPDIVPRITGAPDTARGVSATEIAKTPKAVALARTDVDSQAMPWGLAWEPGGLAPREEIVRDVRLPDGTTQTVVVTIPLGDAGATAPVPAAPVAPAPVVTDPAVPIVGDPTIPTDLLEGLPTDQGGLVPADPAVPVEGPARSDDPAEGGGDDDVAGDDPAGEDPSAEDPVAGDDPVIEDPSDDGSSGEPADDGSSDDPAGEEDVAGDAPAAPEDAEAPQAPVEDDPAPDDGAGTAPPADAVSATAGDPSADVSDV